MKVLVLGANGMAGSTISRYLVEEGHNVTSFATEKVNHCESIVGNALDYNLLKSTLHKGEYDYAINCIGILNQSAEDNHARAVYLNSYLPHQIVEILQALPTRLIQMSTDCVFSGATGSYTEKCFPDGETFYDRSKALGEICDNKNLTFRNSIVGPDPNEQGIGLFNWFMKQTERLEGYTGAIWTGVTTLTLAKAMECAMKEHLTGLYHLVNNRTINKYELLGLFNYFFRDGRLMIVPKDVIAFNKSLVNTRDDFSFQVPSYEDMVVEMKCWVDDHRELYPHYHENRG